ncbi:MAG: hypothetical protein BGO77_07535 [Caedibacter sp. 37-49]|nr:MAG: hypothetical protein BGO77_07535 [Caedibacter sp. 37-49]
MKLLNTKDSYGLISRLFHWAMAILIISMLIVGYMMTGIQNPELKMRIYDIHKASGVTLLVLVMLRLLWKLNNIAPMLPNKTPFWQVMVSKASTVLLYVMMFLMPISGLLMSLLSGYAINYFGFFKIAPFFLETTLAGSIAYHIHIYSSYALVMLIAMHIVAAFYHHLVLKDNILRRIIH